MAAPRVLFVHGGDDQADAAYRGGHGDWSQALPVVLEKYGHLCLDVAVPEELSGVTVDDYACLLVASLPEETWDRGLADLVIDGAKPSLVERPPPAVARTLGVTRADYGGIEATVVGRAPELRRRAAAYGASPSARVKPPTTRPIAYDERRHWSALPGVDITQEQAEAWAAPPWAFQRWEVDGSAEIWADWHSETAQEARYPALVRRGALFGLAFELFAYLGQAHSAEPWAHGEFRTSPRTNGLEALLLATIDALHAIAGERRIRLLPWPGGKTWALNVRHDFDRPLEPPDVAAVLAAHERAGTASTWYWRSRHLAPAGGTLLRRLRARRKRRRAIRSALLVANADRHEVAHHTERPWEGGEAEQSIIEEAIGAPLLGTSAHGDPDCFRFQGAPNVLWASLRGLLYTELIQRAHLHPHRFVAMDRNGRIVPLDVICLPHHESFDLSMKPGDTAPERILRMTALFAEAGGLLQVMNHPDLNVDELFETLASLPDEGRWDCTASQAADWWRRTHVIGAADLRSSPDGVVTAEAVRPFRDARVEILLPDGSTQIMSVDAEAK